MSQDSKQITFKLRHGVHFSDGTPFAADDVAFTMQRLMDPTLHSPVRRRLPHRQRQGVKPRSSLPIRSRSLSPPPSLDSTACSIRLPSCPRTRRKKKPRCSVLLWWPNTRLDQACCLERNPYYWKKDPQGRRLPYLDSIHLDIQSNRDVELLRFKRGELDLINILDTDYFDRLGPTSPQLVHDAGPSLDSDFMWFNQVASAPIPEYKRAWFRSTNFRRAVSEAINRDDLSPHCLSTGTRSPPSAQFRRPTSSGSTTNSKPKHYDPQAALELLEADGFHLQNGKLFDKGGNPVEFSIVTNAGNKQRERMASMIQDDLGKIGIKVNVVTLDFPSLIERITQKFNYEAAMLGFRNIDLDPDGQMNIWLSSAENHAWNPQQKSPETAWEAEIDKLMRAQASTADVKKRKTAFDRVQEIVYEQAPIIYLVNQNALSAVSSSVAGANPGILYPQTFWNAERLTINADRNGETVSAMMASTTIPDHAPCLLSAQVTVRYPGKAPVLRACSLEIARGEVRRTGWPERLRQKHSRIGHPRTAGSPARHHRRQHLFSGRGLAHHARTRSAQPARTLLSLVLQSPLASLNPALRIRTQLREAWRAHRDRTRDRSRLRASDSSKR